jgi:hypothetical protein
MPPPQASEFSREMQMLEVELKRLESDYTNFFTGRLPRPPWENHKRVANLFKRYDRMYIQNTGDRFRFHTLQSRWASSCELWERQMNQMESGRPHFGRARMAIVEPESARGRAGKAAEKPEAAEKESATVAAAPASSSRAQRQHDRVIGTTSVKDPGAQGDRVQELYERLAQAKKEAGEQPVAFEKFSELVRSQVSKLGSGGQEVAFRVSFKNGKVQLTAKTVKGG